MCHDCPHRGINANAEVGDTVRITQTRIGISRITYTDCVHSCHNDYDKDCVGSIAWVKQKELSEDTK